MVLVSYFCSRTYLNGCFKREGMKIILPVAGKGTRVRPHSYAQPKSLVKVANKPIIQYLVEHMLTLHPEEIIVIHDKVNGDWYKKELPRLFPQVTFKFTLQEQQLGTAHVISFAKPFIKEGDDVLIWYCDEWFVKDLSCIKRLQQYDGIIFVKEVHDPERFGVVEYDDQRLMTEMVEKPKHPKSNLANIGVYYVKDAFRLMHYVQRVMDEDRKQLGEYFLTEAWQLMIEDGEKFYVEDVDDWLDVGKIETILEMNKKILRGSTLRGENIVLEKSTLGKNVSIGNNTKLVNCYVENSIIGEDCLIEGLTVKDSIIGDRVKLKINSNSFNIGSDCSMC